MDLSSQDSVWPLVDVQQTFVEFDADSEVTVGDALGKTLQWNVTDIQYKLT